MSEPESYEEQLSKFKAAIAKGLWEDDQKEKPENWIEAWMKEVHANYKETGELVVTDEVMQRLKEDPRFQ